MPSLLQRTMDARLYPRMTGQHFLDNISIRSQTKKFHHFRFSMERPGIVYCREFVSSPEQEFTLLKNHAVIPLASVLPQKIQPEGLSEECRNYLLREIRQFCRPRTENLVAPAP